MKCDLLFMTWNCPDCAEIKSEIDQDFIFEDDRKGNMSQNLVIIQTYSNIGAKSILSKYDCETEFTPLLIKHTNEIVSQKNEIIDYLKAQGFCI